MSTQETQGTPVWPAAGGPQMLTSDADRDTAASLLNAALAEGRLTADEHDQRLSAAYTARTWQQLGQLTADLPARPAATTGQAAPGMFAGVDLCLLCLLLVVCPPAGIAWLFICWHRARTDPDRRLAGTGGPALPGGTVTGGGVVERCRRAVEPAVRGVAGVVVTVALFAAAAAVGGRAGVAIASAWVAVAGSYCVASFWHSRETHCAVTGPGWTLAAVLGFAAALAPGAGLSWYRVNVEAMVFVVILAAGCGLEHVVAARTGRRALGQAASHAQDR